MFSPFNKSGNREEDDKLFLELASSFITSEDGLTTILANLSALLKWYLDDVSWIGFYLFDGEKLRLGPFQGLPACTEIKIGKGVCGTAFKENRTLIVSDVSTFPSHIACSATTKSEIVVPFSLGVLDADSDLLNRFDNLDADLLEAVVHMLDEER